MKVGDVIELGQFLSFTSEGLEVMVDNVLPSGEGEGDVTYLGVLIGRATVVHSEGGKPEVRDVV